ncbi:cysteine protease atg4 [Anaeramoeba flamelloides]|uniref:Cysteine protease n=1 Tax=Anaeramoeba flamelloides TaxID=1746091 RepID=A0ABQ8X6J3_9EUKA|nr:cysteine protease atg4 [Anaeramoeba flamelloides]
MLSRIYQCDKKYSKPEKRWKEFIDDLKSRIFLSYRNKFQSIQGYTSDTGWGCMYRTGQMMLAQAFQRFLLGRDWRFETSSKKDKLIYNTIIRWFGDSSLSPYSIHKMVDVGYSLGIKPGEWHSPTTVSVVLKKLVTRSHGSYFQMYVAQDACIVLDSIEKIALSSKPLNLKKMLFSSILYDEYYHKIDLGETVKETVLETSNIKIIVDNELFSASVIKKQKKKKAQYYQLNYLKQRTQEKQFEEEQNNNFQNSKDENSHVFREIQTRKEFEKKVEKINQEAKQMRKDTKREDLQDNNDVITSNKTLPISKSLNYISNKKMQTINENDKYNEDFDMTYTGNENENENQNENDFEVNKEKIDKKIENNSKIKNTEQKENYSNSKNKKKIKKKKKRKFGIKFSPHIRRKKYKQYQPKKKKTALTTIQSMPVGVNQVVGGGLQLNNDNNSGWEIISTNETSVNDDSILTDNFSNASDSDFSQSISQKTNKNIKNQQELNVSIKENQIKEKTDDDFGDFDGFDDFDIISQDEIEGYWDKQKNEVKTTILQVKEQENAKKRLKTKKKGNSKNENDLNLNSNNKDTIKTNKKKKKKKKKNNQKKKKKKNKMERKKERKEKREGGENTKETKKTKETKEEEEESKTEIDRKKKVKKKKGKSKKKTGKKKKNKKGKNNKKRNKKYKGQYFKKFINLSFDFIEVRNDDDIKKNQDNEEELDDYDNDDEDDFNIISDVKKKDPQIRLRINLTYCDGKNNSKSDNKNNVKKNWWTPIIIFIPIRLGLRSFNTKYSEPLKQILAFPQTLGIVGGKPNTSLYFVAVQKDNLYFLDPHRTQISVETYNQNQFDTKTYHHNFVYRIKVKNIDPSMVIGFLLKDYRDYLDFVHLSKQFLKRWKGLEIFSMI